jgi:hypothetical protein
MGVFDDHKLEQLDWMTQMTETIDSDLNALLAKLPDRTLLTKSNIIETASSHYLDLSVGSMVSNMIDDAKLGYPAWSERGIIYACFAFEIEGEPELDLQAGTLTGGTITLVKKA